SQRRSAHAHHAHLPPPSRPTRRASDLKSAPSDRGGTVRLLSLRREHRRPALPLLELLFRQQEYVPRLLVARREVRLPFAVRRPRSEEHTSELQSPDQLVCCLLLANTNS